MKADYSDLVGATTAFRESCEVLNGYLEAEKNAFLAFKKKEREIRLKYFVKIEEDKMSQAKFNFYLEQEYFDEKLEYHKARTEKNMADNRKQSLHEKLLTVKKMISIQ